MCETKASHPSEEPKEPATSELAASPSMSFGQNQLQGSLCPPELGSPEKLQQKTDQQCTFQTRKAEIEESYQLKENLGSGQFSIVKYAVSKKTQVAVAIKTIKKKDMEGCLFLLENEIDILRQVKHRNIVSLYEVVEDEENFHLVMESVLGGDLFEHLYKMGLIPEKQTVKIIKQLLTAIKYLHDQNVIHGDIKPENILLSESAKQIKLADFGFSMKLKNGLDVNDGLKRGTPQYVAPEILKGNRYGKPSDMFSIGVLTYILLSGREPFLNETANREAKYTFNVDQSPVWYDISAYAFDFINKLMDRNPTTRMTIDQALAHPWIVSNSFDLVSFVFQFPVLGTLISLFSVVIKNAPLIVNYRKATPSFFLNFSPPPNIEKWEGNNM